MRRNYRFGQKLTKGLSNVKAKNISMYAKISQEANEAVFSGITFADFIECESIQVENLLLLKSSYIGDKQCYNFQLLEGKDDIAKLALENIYHYGDFCFVDYANPESVRQLTGEQIAELLYMAHLFKPLKSPFLDTLQNNYVYLSHDDGWYCKLYGKEQQNFILILLGKLLKCLQKDFCNTVSSLPEKLVEKVAELSVHGLFIQLDIPKQRNKTTKKNKVALIRLYKVGEYKNMDDLFNNIEHLQSQSSFEIATGTGKS